jgi:thiazole synthase
MNDVLKIGDYTLSSRLIVGTGKYTTNECMVAALSESETSMVTVAIGRVDFNSGKEKNILNFIDRKKYILLPNTAGAYSVEDAVRIAHLSEAAGAGKLIKLEVLGDKKTLLPDTVGLLEATKILVKEGFTVMPYTNDDPIMAKRLEDAGAACVMPLASPIGSGRGIQDPINILFVKEAVSCPVIVDAGVGTASDAAVCMELGVDGVLMNTAIACAKDPVRMARAMKLAVQAGRDAYFAGRIPKKIYATASSPQEGLALL